MTSCHLIISEIADDNSKKHKEAVLLREAQNGNTELFSGLKMCYDSMITFGVKQIPEQTSVNFSKSLSFHEFSEVAEQLIDRELTGNAALKAINDLMNRASHAEWNGWYRRILLKDMRAGFSEKTVNKAVKKAKLNDYLIPVFDCQLAEDGAKHPEKIHGRRILERKLDGVRMIVVVYPTGRVDTYSRNGKEFANFQHIADEFASFADKLEEPMVFDGEVMSDSFQNLMKQLNRKKDVDASDAVYYVFDVLSHEEFRLGYAGMKQFARTSLLTEILEANPRDHIKMLEQDEVNFDTEEGREAFKKINEKVIAEGYEGLMIKNPYQPYECKRTVNWLKIKPYIEVTLDVIAIEEGTGKNQGKLGALVCQGEDDGRIINVNVGSGFTDSDRDDYYRNPSSVVNHKVEVRADAITQNQDGTYSLRFPRFMRFRGFEAGEKI